MTTSSSSQTTPADQNRNAVLTQIALRSPQRFSTPAVIRKTGQMRLARLPGGVRVNKGGITTAEEVAEITIGTDPQVLIRRAVNLVSPGPLRTFLASVMAERDVNCVLTVLRADGPRLQRLPIERLRAAAQCGANASLLSPRVRDTLYTAILVSGIALLLGQTVKHPHSPADVIRSVVRDALRRLDDTDEAQSHALRNCMGWGNEDEMSDVQVQRLQYCVAVAVQDLEESMALRRRHHA